MQFEFQLMFLLLIFLKFGVLIQITKNFSSLYIVFYIIVD
jgi:hypothetical protein